jgi:hypothetical protein
MFDSPVFAPAAETTQAITPHPRPRRSHSGRVARTPLYRKGDSIAPLADAPRVLCDERDRRLVVLADDSLGDISITPVAGVSLSLL